MRRRGITIALLALTCVSLPAGRTVAEPEAAVRAEFDKLLAASEIAFRHPPAGPVAVEVKSFWEDDDDPRFQLKVSVADLPHIGDKHAGRLVVTHVWNRAKQDVFNSEKWDSEFFQSMTFTEEAKGFGNYTANRSIHLKPGTKPEDIAAIEGTLFLRVPTGVETLQLSAADQDKTRKCANATIVLKKLSGKDVSFTYKGDETLLRSTRGYNDEGEEVGSTSASAMTMGSTRRSNIAFKSEVIRLRVTVAGGIIEKEFPFVLKR